MRLFIAVLWVIGVAAPGLAGPVVFAAASLKGPLDVIVAQFNDQTGQGVVVSYAASSTLARQIEFGAPADLFVSAHPAWVAHLEGLVPFVASPQVILSNRLVVAGRKGAGGLSLTEDGFTAGLGDGRLAVPMISSVPLGIYTREALGNLNLWPSVADKLAQTDNALTARKLLELGEVPLAVLYASDTFQADGIVTLAEIPTQAHSPIEYSAVVLTDQGVDFARFLDSTFAAQVYVSMGFAAP